MLRETVVGTVVLLGAVVYSRATMPTVLNVLISVVGCLLCLSLIPAFHELFLDARLFGIDLNKEDTFRNEKGVLQGKKVPEALGVVVGAVYLICMFIFIPFQFSPVFYQEDQAFPHDKFTELLAALLSISSMIMLGFADDVLNLRWRHKLLLPTIATLPLLMVYFVNVNSTTIMVPNVLRGLLGTNIDVGVFYYLYMGMLAVFCTNAINILAGINGLEAGQSVVIALSILTHNIIQLGGELHDNNLFSLFLITPFVGTTFALLYYNWYPSRVFVGDTFCYFAGMTFAVVGILGRFSKTVLLFFIPQVINFLFSLPQLFRVIPCPRHRLPRFEKSDGLLHTSRCTFKPAELGGLGKLCYAIIRALGMVEVDEIEKEGKKTGDVSMSNLTIINYAIKILGPTHEEKLTKILLGFQVVCSIFGMFVRYKLAGVFYEVVR